MKILIFHQYFSTNKGSYGTRLYEFTKNWVAAGHQVTIVTSVYYKSDLRSTNIGKAINVEGINVIVLKMPINNKDNFLKRIYYFLLYSFLATKYAFREDYDVVMASSGPISTGIPALIGKFFRKKKFVFEVRDLWPGVVEEIGVISNGFILKFAYFFEKILYNQSDLIVTLSPGMTENINSRFSNKKIISITNSANLDLFKPNSNDFSKKKHAIYIGNIGQVNNSNLILNAAKLLLAKGRKDIQILMIGDGQMYLEILGRVKMENICNLTVMKSLPKKQVVGYLHNSFASLIPLLDKPLLDTSSPNKLFESLAAGVPVVQTTKGWIKDLLHDSKAGFSVSASDAAELADMLIELYDNEQLQKETSVSARMLAEDRFDTYKLSHEMLDNILLLIN